MQQMQPTAPRNSNLRELPIAPSHVLDMGSSRCSTASAQVKPVISTSPPSRPGAGSRATPGKTEAKVKPLSPVVQPKEEAKTEPEVGLSLLRDNLGPNRKSYNKLVLLSLLSSREFFVKFGHGFSSGSFFEPSSLHGGHAVISTCLRYRIAFLFCAFARVAAEPVPSSRERADHFWRRPRS